MMMMFDAGGYPESSPPRNSGKADGKKAEDGKKRRPKPKRLSKPNKVALPPRGGIGPTGGSPKLPKPCDGNPKPLRPTPPRMRPPRPREASGDAAHVHSTAPNSSPTKTPKSVSALPKRLRGEKEETKPYDLHG